MTPDAAWAKIVFRLMTLGLGDAAKTLEDGFKAMTKRVKEAEVALAQSDMYLHEGQSTLKFMSEALPQAVKERNTALEERDDVGFVNERLAADLAEAKTALAAETALHDMALKERDEARAVLISERRDHAVAMEELRKVIFAVPYADQPTNLPQGHPLKWCEKCQMEHL